jgi:hypothetical protein
MPCTMWSKARSSFLIVGCGVFGPCTSWWVLCLAFHSRTCWRCSWPQWPCHHEVNRFCQIWLCRFLVQSGTWNSLWHWCKLSQLDQSLILF